MSFANVAKPLEPLIVRQVRLLVFNVKLRVDCVDIESGIVVFVPDTDKEPLVILIPDATEPPVIFPTTVIEPVANVLVPILTDPVSLIVNLAFGVVPVVIVKLVVPFVCKVIGILASVPCARIELLLILNCDVAVPVVIEVNAPVPDATILVVFNVLVAVVQVKVVLVVVSPLPLTIISCPTVLLIVACFAVNAVVSPSILANGIAIDSVPSNATPAIFLDDSNFIALSAILVVSTVVHAIFILDT